MTCVVLAIIAAHAIVSRALDAADRWKAYSRAHRLAVDGRAGPETRRVALGAK